MHGKKDDACRKGRLRYYSKSQWPCDENMKRETCERGDGHDWTEDG